LTDILYYIYVLDRHIRMTNVKFFMSAHMFVQMEHVGSHWTDFHEI